MAVPFPIEPLDGSIHNRAAFTCGIEPLDRYIRQQASQDVRNLIASVHVLRAEADVSTIIGYYTLNSYTIDLANISPKDALRLRLPRHRTLPATLIGRLAVDQRYHRQSHGKRLLYDALYRSLQQSAQIASWAVVVDAKNEEAAAFYEHHDFFRYADHPLKFYLPMKLIAAMFADAPAPE